MLLTKIKEIRNGRMIVKDSKVKDGVKERINYKGWMIVVYDDGDVLLTDPYNNSVGWPEYNSVEKAKRDIDKSMKEGLYDSKDEAIDPTTPKNIAKAKSLSVAQGKAATGDKKTKDVSYEVIWKEKQGGSEQRRVFPSKEEADRFVAHKERVDSRSYGVIVLKTTDDDKNKDPFIQRQIEIAKKTLKMPGAMVGVMGGMTKAEAKEILKKYGVSEDSKVKDGVKERINYKGWMIVVYDDGDVLLTDPYNNSVGWPEYNSVEKAKRDIDKSMKEGLYDSKDEAIDPTTPKNIAKAKSLSVAQGKAATGDKKTKDIMSESQVKSLCKQAGREFLADNPDGDLDQAAGDIAEGMAFSNPQILEFLKKHFGGSVTRRQAREYLADLI